jgi:hypothetical protein
VRSLDHSQPGVGVLILLQYLEFKIVQAQSPLIQ